MQYKWLSLDLIRYTSNLKIPQTNKMMEYE
jgi:hypothetical protein